MCYLLVEITRKTDETDNYILYKPTLYVFHEILKMYYHDTIY